MYHLSLWIMRTRIFCLTQSVIEVQWAHKSGNDLRCLETFIYKYANMGTIKAIDVVHFQLMHFVFQHSGANVVYS